MNTTAPSARRGRWVRPGIAMLAVASLALSGCGAASKSDSGKTKFGLVSQLSIGSYFAVEAKGAKARAKKLGVDLSVVDAGQDTAKQINMSKSLITSGVDALAIVPSNTDIGPRVSALTKRAGIPLVASDSPLKDSSGKAVPFVGLNQVESGTQVGEILSREFLKRGWKPAETLYADVEASELQVCVQRTDASVAAFEKAVPGYGSKNVVKVPYDGTPGTATTAMRAAITAHPEAKHWVVSSCNDDGVVGAMRALQAKGAKADQVLGVGLGGDLACQLYKTPYLAKSIPFSTYLDPASIGATVVQTMYDIVVKKKAAPAKVYVPTPEMNAGNFQRLAHCK